MVRIIVVIKIPICPAVFHAIYEEYSQKISEIKLKISPSSGFFIAVSVNPKIVVVGSMTCVSLLNQLFLFICAEILRSLCFRQKADQNDN